MFDPYMCSVTNEYVIDKTEALEKAVRAYPSVYLEGAAASGKTTAVRMLLEKYPQVRTQVFWIEEERKDADAFLGKLSGVKERMKQETVWVILENLSAGVPETVMTAIVNLIYDLPPECRVLLVSRERPWEALLELLWKRNMELLPQKTLLFTKEEVRRLASHMESTIHPEEIYEETGGWAGCTDLMLRLSVKGKGEEKRTKTAKMLRNSYEIHTYIKKEILDTLTEAEKEIMRRGAVCPWLNEELCTEVWGMPDAADTLERLERKGLFLQEENRWREAPLFRENIRKMVEENGRGTGSEGFWKHLGTWYEQHGALKEALACYLRLEDENAYRAAVTANYDKIPFLEMSYDRVAEWTEESPQICYLRGMYCYTKQNMEGLEREIRKLEKLAENGESVQEILLNLYYVKPDISLDTWLERLEAYGTGGQTFRLYNIIGNSYTFLCGLRDLSGLFACAKKEENRKARIWKEYLGKEEWDIYLLAQLDYYLMTERKDAVKDENWEVLYRKEERASGQMRLVRMYLFCKMQSSEEMEKLEEGLIREESRGCAQNAEAISNLYSPWRGEQQKFVRWVYDSEREKEENVTEENYAVLGCKAKGYLLLNQHTRAEKIVSELIDHLRFYRRTRFLAEVLFQQALIHWEEDRKKDALRSLLESFTVGGACRYVQFYADYGKKGNELLEEYVRWRNGNLPKRQHQNKKKYNYGNVLRMPMEEYLEVLLRISRRVARNYPDLQEESVEEKLTMMETLIFQSISRGMTNAEICEELNLKLPTVKSHVYNLYKKLGAGSRVQAILKGKELGILN